MQLGQTLRLNENLVYMNTKWHYNWSTVLSNIVLLIQINIKVIQIDPLYLGLWRIVEAVEKSRQTSPGCLQRSSFQQ